MNLLAKWDRKYGKYAIKNIMIYLIIGYVISWFFINFNAEFYVKYLYPDMSLVFKGQVWRIISIIFMPPEFGNALFFAINMYFLYFIGQMLEKIWSSFVLNMFLVIGIGLHVIVAIAIYLIFGVNVCDVMYGSYYITMALFVLVGMSVPDMSVLLLFIIPIKMKWLAVLTLSVLVGTIGFTIAINTGFIEASWNFIYGLMNIGIYPSLSCMVSASISLITFFIMYFLMRGYGSVSRQQKKRKKEYEKTTKVHNVIRVHKCAICGRTDKDDDSLQFRYCSKCNGAYEYCQDHLWSHEHKK